MSSRTDIIIGLQYGDEGKGKIVNYLSSKYSYDYCIRYNGGANAGHTIYIDKKKFVTHQIPTGFLYGIPSIIGDNCYLDVNKLVSELKYIKENANKMILDRLPTLYVSEKCHIITPEHKGEDDIDDKIGTTKSGIGPCSKDKYSRTGTRVIDCQETKKNLKEYNIEIINTTDFLMNAKLVKNNLSYLVEGAQGFGLDINHGDYPYCTSSHCIASDCFNLGIPFRENDNYKVNIYGIAKLYETYVGNKEFHDLNNEELKKIQKEGHEFGSTTERPRQCNYLDLNYLLKSIWVNQCNIVYINKCDVLDNLKYFKLYWNKTIHIFSSIDLMKEFIIDIIKTSTSININSIHFEHSPYLTHTN